MLSVVVRCHKGDMFIVICMVDSGPDVVKQPHLMKKLNDQPVCVAGGVVVGVVKGQGVVGGVAVLLLSLACLLLRPLLVLLLL